MRYEIVFSGSGGQGMILSGKITAEAAATYDKMHSTQTQSYGPESRGGMTEAYVIISDEPVDYPEITKADIIVALSQDGLDRQIRHIKDDTIIVVDEEFVNTAEVSKYKTFKAPFTNISREIMNSPISANMVALGMVTAISNNLSKEGMIETMKKNVPNGTEEKNVKAFEKGFELGSK
ncbi:MAG: 2-oxoacid:ferredoxin oxidoreductase subunit gamma [Candidatus Mcinerneyibacterium aminivorans]|uniref:2-oxoacid:ferredoxin oxidoreductase subunit gamma n=1 Tax=Candidatus Mcinerneyibacterium aminivorans TaxID=2703815 RepID=A0A5D0MIF1_9BACT|nr:MAG: 2-oxoacid:ferredoxin oxidoreductase subunit gamma [Candidatus Mcinerneyibacterium aminivorans]